MRERAFELAALDGRTPQDAGKSDWEQAKYDLIGVPDLELEPKAPIDTNGQNDSNPDSDQNAQTPSWLA